MNSIAAVAKLKSTMASKTPAGRIKQAKRDKIKFNLMVYQFSLDFIFYF
jgi:hypothetical protein